MSTSIIPLSISIVSTVCSIICFIIAFIREDNNKANIIAGFCIAIISVISIFQIRVSEPSIEPRNEQVPIDKKCLEVSIHSTEPNYVKLFYSFEGDPKYNSKNEYNDKFAIFESTTICARNKFLFWWSDMDEKSYEFAEAAEASITQCQKNDDIRVVEEVEQIQNKYYNLPEPNSLPEPTPDQPINKCYDDNNMKIIKVYCGYGEKNILVCITMKTISFILLLYILKAKKNIDYILRKILLSVIKMKMILYMMQIKRLLFVNGQNLH